MKNLELVKIFYEMADYLEAERIAFKPFAYRKAAISLEAYEEDIRSVYNRGGRKALLEISGIGESIAEKIEEYLQTGSISAYEKLKRSLPVDLSEITAVEGVGPKRAKVLYRELGIKNLADLEKAARGNNISTIFGFGEKAQKNILEGISFVKRSKGRFLLGEILPKAKEVLDRLKVLKAVKKVEIAGSLRRRKETIGDIDFLVILSDRGKESDATEIMDFFTSQEGIVKIWNKGSTKASVRTRKGFDMDIRILPSKSYGAALQYFTGSKDHNVELRKIAIEKGLKLSEYGLFKGSEMISGESEEDIYRLLGMPWIPPELREGQGEIAAALEARMPELIKYSDILGDLHCHSDWDGGDDSIGKIADTAEEMGYNYIGIADHTKFLRIENGLNEKDLEKRNREIDRINKRRAQEGKKTKILKGCEANIMSDGSIDINDEALEKLDFVIAGIHSDFKMEKDKMTKRLIKAMENPNVDIISHPTGRLLKKRDEYRIDMEKIFKAAEKTKTILEINSYPQRLDLNDRNIREAKKNDVKMIINTDAHSVSQMACIEFGVAQARRGWAEKKDIVNTQPLEIFLKQLK